MYRNISRITTLLVVILIMLLFCASASALDFYGEGNLLVAVDMGAYAENEDVSYPEGTMGTLVWGADAPEGESTVPAFAPKAFTVPEDIAAPVAPAYEIRTKYQVGQKMMYPYSRGGVIGYFTQDEFPEEVFDENGLPLFPTCEATSNTTEGITYYCGSLAQLEDGTLILAMDFLECECLAVSDHFTLWVFTGQIYSKRSDFNLAEYNTPLELTEEEIGGYMAWMESTWETESRVCGDPGFMDARGDCDGKTALFCFPFPGSGSAHSAFDPNLIMYYGTDGINLNTDSYLETKIENAPLWKKNMFRAVSACEYNQYILRGIVKDGDADSWTLKAIAGRAAMNPESGMEEYLLYRTNVRNFPSRMRLLPGILWSEKYEVSGPNLQKVHRGLTPFMLSWIEKQTTGGQDDRFWTAFLAEYAEKGRLNQADVDAYLQKNTGESLKAWTARFMALAAADPESVGLPALMQLDPYTFYRDWHSFGVDLGSFNSPQAVDEVAALLTMKWDAAYAVQGGGSVYVYRNDEGGKIAVTGAEDRWVFHAFTVDLPGERPVIGISEAEQLRKIGLDPDWPESGRYILNADLDLGGEDHPWIPIGQLFDTPFTGEFDGNGHRIDGLYIDSTLNVRGLFNRVEGNALIRDLTVAGSMTGVPESGGITGYMIGGRVENCRNEVSINTGNISGGIIGYQWRGTVCGCVNAVPVAGNGAVGGIVGYVWEGTVRDCINMGPVTGNGCLGGIVGFLSWAAVEKCRNEGAVDGVLDIGGVAGYCDGGTIIGCRNDGPVRGESSIAGIVGDARQYTNISNCFNQGPISAVRYTAGIAGVLQGNETQSSNRMENCCNIGTVSGETNVGGLVGYSMNAVINNSCSYTEDLPIAGKTEYGGEITSSFTLSETEQGDGWLTSAEFKDPASFTGWDFEKIWSLENGLYPMLREWLEK